jgi:hypothetical protein
MGELLQQPQKPVGVNGVTQLQGQRKVLLELLLQAISQPSAIIHYVPPALHQQAQQNLQQSWPALANAIRQLAAAS